MNIAQFLPRLAAREPAKLAVRVAKGPPDALKFDDISYAELDRRSDAIAGGLVRRGLQRGDRVCVFVKPGIDLIAVTFGLLKAAAVPVLIDPGMGREALLSCVERMQPKAFVGIPRTHALRKLFRKRFRTVQLTLTVGKRLFWGGPTLDRLLAEHDDRPVLADTLASDEAAILFTSGSTGPAKGVVYTHGMFHAQVLALKRLYAFGADETDAACFPLFALFSPALEMTCVFPELDPSKPASCDPARVVAAIKRTSATSTFGSPAIWRRVVPWCLEHGVELPTLRRVLIAGAPVPPSLVEGFHRVLAPNSDVHTPYGATESLPVSSIAGREIIEVAAERSAAGAGTCVGRPAPGIDLRIIRVTDQPIAKWSDELELSAGEIGEITVLGPVVTHQYKFEPRHTAAAKLDHAGRVRHRIGDLGYLDADGRLWFLGRKSHRLETANGMLPTVGVEGIFNTHPRVHRSALVGVGPAGGERPYLWVEPTPDEFPANASAEQRFANELREHAGKHPAASVVEGFLFHRGFPVDVRHNAKIHRDNLKREAEARLA
ncbi:MAG: AMP-binding protein [Planctomycetes bacterium]|nr:AMP-binding protein [Planctomycetota bacterium]